MLPPIVPPAPVRLSTTSWWPSTSPIWAATTRAMASIDEPGVCATISRMGRAG
jgi:hypothetical protein